MTNHSDRGLTTERVLIHADIGVPPDLFDWRFGFVTISRASHDATISTSDTAGLGQQS